jgi:glycosyltransferase involved in cell wall biosynthesis
MMQKTDFEFELVIGEDCSQDKTREICFEYQKKYPDKIRVLWWHENVSKLGGNGLRNRAHCRGEFIAFCEGDDYWIDPLKLQKQVDVMRKHPNVGLCFGAADSVNQVTGEIIYGNPVLNTLYIMPGAQFNEMRGCGISPEKYGKFNDNQIRTMTALCRTSTLKQIVQKNAELFSWRLYLGDFQMWMMLAHCSNVAFLPDKVAVYRIHPGGITSRRLSAVIIDSQVVSVWYKANYLGVKVEDEIILRKWVVPHYYSIAMQRSFVSQIVSGIDARKLKPWCAQLKAYRRGFDWMMMSIGMYRKSIVSMIIRLLYWVNRK